MWSAAGFAEAKMQYRRVSGHLHLQALPTALDQHVERVIHLRSTLPIRKWPHSSATLHAGRDFLPATR